MPEANNSTEESEMIKERRKEEEQKNPKFPKAKYEPSINQVVKLYAPTQSMSFERRTISKLKNSGLLPNISDSVNFDSSERR